MHRVSVCALALILVFAGCGREAQPTQPALVAPVDVGASLQQTQAAPTGCQRVNTQYMSTTSDFGGTFLSYRTPTQRGLSLTWGIAALDDAGTLLMQADDALWGSENDGCSWTRIRMLPKMPRESDRVSTQPGGTVVGIYRVEPASEGYGYAWEDNGGNLFRVRFTSGPGSSWEVTALRGPSDSMHGLGVDPNDPLHVRAAGNDGWIHESFDGGASWAPRGVPAMPGGTLGYVIRFDASDLDHAVYGRVSDGGFVTFDGGRSWTQSAGLASVPGGRVNLFNAVISPVDGSHVFAMGIDITESLGSAPSGGRHIYASTDGGLSFVPVLDHLSDGVFLSNGPIMLGDPSDAQRLVFLSSSKPAFGGTTFYAYDLGSGQLTSVHNDSIPQVRVLAYSRVAPGALHAGFDWF